MGGQPYWYFVPHKENVHDALRDLRKREFAAGRYNPVVPALDFSDPHAVAQAPGPRHATIAEALAAAGATGTRSILDIDKVSTDAAPGIATPIDQVTIRDLYGTREPTRAMFEATMAFMHEVGRGQCVYTVVYDAGRPSELLFAGYSYD